MISQVQINTKASVSVMETTVPKVENGLVLTREASKLLDDIQTQANGSLENVLVVVQDTSSQVSTIESIKGTVAELDLSSRETSHALKESFEQANRLGKLSTKLNCDIDFFSV